MWWKIECEGGPWQCKISVTNWQSLILRTFPAPSLTFISVIFPPKDIFWESFIKEDMRWTEVLFSFMNQCTFLKHFSPLNHIFFLLMFILSYMKTFLKNEEKFDKISTRWRNRRIWVYFLENFSDMLFFLCLPPPPEKKIQRREKDFFKLPFSILTLSVILWLSTH